MNCQSGYLFGAVGFGVGFHIVCLSKVERVAIEVALATVDQPDVPGRSRIIVIRRELPHTTNASLAEGMNA